MTVETDLIVLSIALGPARCIQSRLDCMEGSRLSSTALTFPYTSRLLHEALYHCMQLLPIISSHHHLVHHCMQPATIPVILPSLRVLHTTLHTGLYHAVSAVYFERVLH